jgi:LmbE family N-acetylglucosaminyl deacetylase
MAGGNRFAARGAEVEVTVRISAGPAEDAGGDGGPGDGPTPHRRWTYWSAVAEQARPWELPAGRLLLVVPHPDDEALSTGGLLARRAGGAPVTVAAVTDGEAAYADAGDLAATRRREQHRSLAVLGQGRARVERLGLPDGAVAAHESALGRVLTDLAGGCELVVAPWPLDHHCDHEATGRAAALAARAVGATFAGSLFWAWHHPPLGTSPPELVRLSLTTAERRRKTRAIAQHRSQLRPPGRAPVVTPSDLGPATWPDEHYVVC